MKDRPEVTAHARFARRAGEFQELPLDQVFAKIHATNLWGSEDSVSGLGSELAATERLRVEIPRMLEELGARVLLDLPCGDFEWLSRTALPVERYIGGDIVEALVTRNRELYGREFQRLDLCADALPKADVVLCRDCLVHLSLANIRRAVENLKRSGSQWLLTTTFPECEENVDIQDGDWRMLNFELAPFGWGKPARLLVEGCTESGGGYEDKSLGLWRIADLP